MYAISQARFKSFCLVLTPMFIVECIVYTPYSFERQAFVTIALNIFDKKTVQLGKFLLHFI